LLTFSLTLLSQLGANNTRELRDWQKKMRKGHEYLTCRMTYILTCRRRNTVSTSHAADRYVNIRFPHGFFLGFTVEMGYFRV